MKLVPQHADIVLMEPTQMKKEPQIANLAVKDITQTKLVPPNAHSVREAPTL